MQESTSRRPLTRIVATAGPTADSEPVIEQMVQAGVSTFRLNFSHGTHESHREVFRIVREVSARAGRTVTILQDLQGPKLRIGELEGSGPIDVQDGDSLVICTRPVIGTAARISTDYVDLGRDVRPGHTILIDDGLIELRVTDVRFDTFHGDEVVTEVIHGGPLLPRKGINLPGTHVSQPALTEKDLSDLKFGIDLGVDMVALSFVRSPQDVIDAKDVVRSLGGTQPLISKIEKPQAVERLEEIVIASDGIMVARGDLGVEMSADQVPLIQKRLIRLANIHGKPVITATQMLESMIQNPRPTRAEASDIANAILDGTDALMLSGETANGQWPVRAVNTMANIARTIEADDSWDLAMKVNAAIVLGNPSGGEAQAIAQAAASIARHLNPRAIVVLSATGRTAMRVAQQRPGVPILAFSDQPALAGMLSLWHGIEPIYEELATNIDDLITQVEDGVRNRGYANPGDLIVIVGSVPRNTDARAVFLEVHRLP